MIKKYIPLLFLVIVIGATGYFLDYGGLFRYRIHTEKSKDIEDDGRVTYSVRFWHWRNFDIVRSKYYFGVAKKDIDSLAAIEEAVRDAYRDK